MYLFSAPANFDEEVSDAKVLEGLPVTYVLELGI